MASLYKPTRLISELSLSQTYPQDTLLKAAHMARSTYFYHRQSSGQRDKYADVKQQIKTIYHQHKGRYGYRRITLALRQAGGLVNHKCVYRLMQMRGLKSRMRLTKYRSYRGEVGKVTDNLLQRPA